MITSIMNGKNVKLNMQRAGALLFWLLVWQAASLVLKQEILLASPVSVAERLSVLMKESDFWASVVFSFTRIITGFLLALVCGIVLAVASFCSRIVSFLVNPLMSVAKSTPVASFIILCLIWIPSRNLSVFISFLIVLPVIYTNILEGINKTDRKLLEMAKVFKIPLWRRIVFIYLSQILPYLISACTVTLGMSWKAGVAAEVIGVPSGSIGEKLYQAKIYLDTPDLFAWTAVIIVISFLFEKLFIFLLKSFIQWVESR